MFKVAELRLTGGPRSRARPPGPRRTAWSARAHPEPVEYVRTLAVVIQFVAVVGPPTEVLRGHPLTHRQQLERGTVTSLKQNFRSSPGRIPISDPDPTRYRRISASLPSPSGSPDDWPHGGQTLVNHRSITGLNAQLRQPPTTAQCIF